MSDFILPQAPPRAGSVTYLLAGAFHRMAFVEWGDPAAPPVICLHGLTRNGRDFDPLAAALADRFRVICPDLPGRGASDWLADPLLYQTPHYITALGHLLARLDQPAAWVGTSLGGICGLLLAATPGAPIHRLVLNDVGPFIPADAMARIRQYLVAASDSPRLNAFPDRDGLERYLRLVHAPFGPLSDAQWAFLAAISGRRLADGRLALHYDPAIAEPLRAHTPADVDIWSFWSRLRIPVLAIRGADSDVLTRDALARMAASGAAVVELPGIGHAPALLDTDQIALIRGFLTGAAPA
jgi:pimeloyl-ACP methyl ester carboxylesterase